MTKKQSMWYRGAAHLIVGPIISAVMKLRCIGEKNIPNRGSALIVSNHRSWTDPIFTAIETRRPINFLAASFNFYMPVVGWVFKNSGVIPLYLEKSGKNEPSLKKCIRLLRKGNLVGVYPEGMQNFLEPGGKKVKSFHTGFARIALAANAKIIPIAVIAQKEVIGDKTLDFLMKPFMKTQIPKGVDMNIFKIITYRERVTIRIGEPISIDEYYYQIHTKDLLNTIAGRVRRTVVKLYEEGLDYE